MTRADEVLRSLKLSLELLPSPIMLASIETDELWMNAAFMRLINRNPEGSVDSLERIVTAERRPFSVFREGRRLPADKLPSALSVHGQSVTGLPVQMHLDNGRIVEVLAYAGPVKNESGEVLGGIVTCFDVSEQEKRSTERLRFLADAGEALTESMSVGSLVKTLQRLIVPHVAAYCSISLLGESGRPSHVFTHHVDPNALQIALRLQKRLELEPQMFEIAVRAFEGGHAFLIPDLRAFIEREELDEAFRAYMRAMIEEVGLFSAVSVPMRLRGRVVGAIVVADRRHRRFSAEDLGLLEDLGRRAAGALESARSLERHEQSSSMLQRALLPSRLPLLKSVRFDAVYAPGGDEALIGGDWYDALEISQRSVLVTIGDVAGRGLQAAVLMSKVRQSLAALSSYETDPVKLLDVVDRSLRMRQPDAMVTAIAGILDRNGMMFTYATAGHPPPYLRRGDAVIQLPCHGLPLGLRSDSGASMTVKLQPGDVLLFYTDGLTESTHDLAAGERRVVSALRSADGGDVARYIQDLVLPDGSPDDVALLVMRIEGAPAGQRSLRLSFDARDVRMARESRVCMTEFLRENGAPAESLQAAEIVYGELISNVVQHAPGHVTVEIDWSGEYPALCVIDNGKGYAESPHLPSDPFSESGRGLFIVSALTREFSVRTTPLGGSDVCALLDIPRVMAEPGSLHSRV